ncbi:MAG TPA: CoA-transferase, partial [Spirochaetia bacterium]|nr:CoA-transferase [Spirochaetia bacterium]
MPRIVSANEAAEVIKDGATIAVGSMGLSSWPEEVARAIESRFLVTGHPRDLNVVQGSSAGDKKERGVTRWGHEGLIRRWMGAHIGFSPRVCRLITDNKIEAYCIPQGVIVNLWREIAAKRPGLITKVGLGTFVDPRVEGGRMNERTKDDIFSVIKIDGEEYLLYRSFPVDVAIIRGTTIDECGNMTMEREGVLMEQLQLAQAAHNSGGIVIAQAEY